MPAPAFVGRWTAYESRRVTYVDADYVVYTFVAAGVGNGGDVIHEWTRTPALCSGYRQSGGGMPPVVRAYEMPRRCFVWAALVAISAALVAILADLVAISAALVAILADLVAISAASVAMFIRYSMPVSDSVHCASPVCIRYV